MSETLHTPATEEEAAQIIAEAAGNRPLRIQGSGSKSASFSSNADTLSSAGLSGIVAYNPAELVMTAKAGTPMQEIEAALEKHKQMLAFEPGSWASALGGGNSQTIGGIAAANQSGSRRFVAGAARDSLLGVRFVNGKGEIIKNGGRVMKNVTGLDLVKLMAGSWGALSLLTEVSFKVLPVAASQKTLAIAVQDDAEATAIMAAAMATSADPSGVAILPQSTIDRLKPNQFPARGHVLIRFEGFVASVDERMARVRSQLNLAADVSVLDPDPSRDIWSHLNELSMFKTDTEKQLWRLSVPPTKGIALAASLAANDQDTWFADWQGGLVWLELTDPAVNVHDLARLHGGHAVLLRRGAATDPAVPTFSPQNAALANVSLAVKRSMDPREIFQSPLNLAKAEPVAA
ncbi:MAG: FAD-binding protein [Pseudomonadota bacterium]